MSAINKQLVEKVNESFQKGNPEGFLDLCCENMSWTMVGERTAHCKAEIREWLSQSPGCGPPEFKVDTLIAEADTVVCTGKMKMSDKDGVTTEFGYCDVYRFTGDKIAELTTFIVKTGTDRHDERSAAA
jgi:ketosteroid isomerase-like protein